MKRNLLLVAVALAALILAPLSSFAAGSRTKPAKPERIAQGQEVKLEDYLVPGKTTIFDFTSEFCPPCRAISPRLDELHATRDDIVVVKVDINRPNIKGIDWQSPVARQYNMNSIPHFKVFGPDGKLIAEGKEARALVTGWFK
jgi:thiol-disulfide isomerase/thioredoxin